MKSLILYHSRTGTTRKYGEEIANFLKKNDVESNVTSIDEFKKEDLDNVSFVFLGCWTSGLMIMGQHPEKEWIDFVRQVPELGDKKIGLFTTYKIATGSMFKKMKKNIPNANGNVSLLLKSRNGSLSINDQLNLLDFTKDRPTKFS
jgi:flavodoxin